MGGSRGEEVNLEVLSGYGFGWGNNYSWRGTLFWDWGTCIGMKYLLMGDGDRWKSVSPWHGSTRLKPSKKIWLDLLVGKVSVDSGTYYSVAECWKLHGSKG